MLIDINKVLIITMVPSEYTEKIREEVCKKGAGTIGNYNYCSFLSKGIGTFEPNNQATPFIGENNKLEFVKEDKLEFVCNIDDVKEVLKALRKAHPYEEPGINLIPLLDPNKF